MSDREALKRFVAAVEGIFPFRPGETLDAYCDRAVATLKIGQRAMLLARLDNEMRAVARERQEKKNIWISDARASFTASARRACFVCGKYREITHAHHVIPLTAQFDRDYRIPEHEHEWLCPNHHAVLHSIIPPEGVTAPEKIGARASGALADMSTKEIERLLDLVRRSGRMP